MEAKKITSKEDLEIAFQIRTEVFVHEQGTPLEEEFDKFDRLDAPCDHILVYYEGKAVGSGRFRIVDGVGKLERIVILKPYRKYGLGRKIIKVLEDMAQEQGLKKVKLHGQKQAEGFYHKLGYETNSDIFMEDGIKHVLMTKVVT